MDEASELRVKESDRLAVMSEGLRRLGVEVKDLNRGLCDLPHRRDDRLVYLCWHPGEEKIEYWHELKAGFADRKPL